jgi:hypothetical protein
MEKKNTTAIRLFEDRKVRSLWDSEQEKWYISIVDVIKVLTESPRPRKYWDDLKRKLHAECSQLSDFFGQLKMESADGTFRGRIHGIHEVNETTDTVCVLKSICNV